MSICAAGSDGGGNGQLQWGWDRTKGVVATSSTLLCSLTACAARPRHTESLRPAVRHALLQWSACGNPTRPNILTFSSPGR